LRALQAAPAIRSKNLDLHIRKIVPKKNVRRRKELLVFFNCSSLKKKLIREKSINGVAEKNPNFPRTLSYFPDLENGNQKRYDDGTGLLEFEFLFFSYEHRKIQPRGETASDSSTTTSLHISIAMPPPRISGTS